MITALLLATAVLAAEPDRCGLSAAHRFIGQLVYQVRAAYKGNPWVEIRCDTCWVRRDHRPQRLRIYYGTKTGLVTDMRCS
jgi:hypothetical protein